MENGIDRSFRNDNDEGMFTPPRRGDTKCKQHQHSSQPFPDFLNNLGSRGSCSAHIIIHEAQRVNFTLLRVLTAVRRLFLTKFSSAGELFSLSKGPKILNYNAVLARTSVFSREGVRVGHFVFWVGGSQQPDRDHAKPKRAPKSWVSPHVRVRTSSIIINHHRRDDNNTP